MKIEVKRYYLEIHSSKEINGIEQLPFELKIVKIDPPDFKLNKFFYKNIGKKHRWIDRLVWTDIKWIDYVEAKKVDVKNKKWLNE